MREDSNGARIYDENGKSYFGFFRVTGPGTTVGYKEVTKKKLCT